MGQFYIHDGKRLLTVGTCQDGMEHMHLPAGVSGARLVLGAPPCDPLTLAPDQEWSIPLRKAVQRPVPEDIQWARVRYQRDQLLTQTDWRVARAQEDGVPLDPLWSQYRQALRDVTLQPLPVVWPTPPEF